ncbi:hypothetical protein ONZ45_g2681 [Pleurotus djamor]|nr:hypothetical protein ONZ45_g2681 [Pleurotus djamor]
MKPLLYDTIFLWKASQVKALASLLRKHSTSTYGNLDHPNTGSWIKRIIIMISNPNERLASSDFAELMSSSRKLTALHIVMHLPDESTRDQFPNPETLFPDISLAAPTLRILNLTESICNDFKDEPVISNDFFAKMTALRALRCDSHITLDKLQPLEYLSTSKYTLEKLKHNNPSIQELSIRDATVFPLSYSPNEHLRRLNLNIIYGIHTSGQPSDNGEDDQADTNPSGSGGNLGGRVSEEEEKEKEMVDQVNYLAELEPLDDPDSDSDSEDVSGPSQMLAAGSEVATIGSDSNAGGGGGLGIFDGLVWGRGDFQTDVLDLLPPTVTYLSLVFGRWKDLLGNLQRLPTTVTHLGLEAGLTHCKDKSYIHLIDICRDLIAPGLTVVQLNHWQICVDLRTRHAGLLKEFVEMLKNKNVELWDAEGSVM